jgi:putative ABC transport system permease protein
LDSGVKDSLKVQELTVVGTVDSPMYISNERGTTNVGSGALSSFVYVDESDFKTSEINELFIKINYDDIYDKFSDEYAGIVDKIAEEISVISDSSIGSKLSELKVEYNTKIFEKQEEINAYNASSALEISEKKKEIDDFKAYVDSEDEILAQKKEQNESEKAALKSTLDSLNSSYNTLKTTYDENVKKFESQSSEIKGYTEQKKLYEDVLEKYKEEKSKADTLAAETR